MEFYTFLIIMVILIIAAIAVTGGVVELLKQRVIVDVSTRQVVEIELPGMGKFKTNYPSLGAIALGLLMCYGVISWLYQERAKVPVTATVTASSSELHERSEAQVFLSVVPRRYRIPRGNVPINDAAIIGLDVDKGEEYIAIVQAFIRDAGDGRAYELVSYGPIEFAIEDGKQVGRYQSELRVR